MSHPFSVWDQVKDKLLIIHEVAVGVLSATLFEMWLGCLFLTYSAEDASKFNELIRHKTGFKKKKKTIHRKFVL